MKIKQDCIITVWPDEQLLGEAVAHLILVESRKAVLQKGYFTFFLSGGNTPRLLYEILAQEPFAGNIPWNKVIIFFGDERFVPHQSEESNFKMASGSLLSKLPSPRKNIFPIQTNRIRPQQSAFKYEEKIKRYITSKFPPDLVLLGLGEDGHIASLFPGTTLLNERKRWVREIFVPEKNMFRISITFPLINAAKNVVILVSGGNKKSIVNKIFSSAGKELPAGKVNPSGNMFWMMDRAAAGNRF